MGNHHLSVVICTWNRCAALAQSLESFTRLTPLGDMKWELIVVNNNSTDQTHQVINTFEGRLPVRQVFERTPGLSHARNRGVAEAEGDYILWTDDDVTLSRDWLVSYAEAFRRWPDAAIFGGPIRPTLDGTPPEWLPRIYPAIEGVYAARDFGPEPIPLSPQVIPWGANYAIRRREQLTRLYDPDLGYRPGRLIGWEEAEVIQALLADGVRGWWVPAAALQHHVPESRQTTKYLRTHFYNRGLYIGSRWNRAEKHHLLGRPRWLWRHVLAAELKYRVHRAVSKPEVWIEHLIESSESWGVLNGYVANAPADHRTRPTPATPAFGPEGTEPVERATDATGVR